MNDRLNDAKEFVCVRVQIVRVKKRFIGYSDKTLGYITLIPNTEKKAEEIFKKIQRMFKKEGVTL